MIGKITGNTVGSHICVDILIENDSDGLGFLFVYDQYAIFQSIPIRSKTTVPPTFAGFLNPSLHGLDPDVLSFDFSNSRKNRDHQLAGIL